MKICRTCNTEKPLTDFPHDKRWRSTYKSDCKVCFNTKRRDSYNPNKNRQQKIQTTYGLDWETYLKLYDSQNGCCALCVIPLDIASGKTKKGKAHIDHCHKTGKVRGLLCTKCNTLLGMANDNISTLANAIKYLDRSQDD